MAYSLLTPDLLDPEGEEKIRTRSFPEGRDKSKGGVCVVGLVVDAHGMPKDVHIVRSLKPDFDANAVAVVRQYRFKAALRKGQPVAVRIHIEVNYKRY